VRDAITSVGQEQTFGSPAMAPVFRLDMQKINNDSRQMAIIE